MQTQQSIITNVLLNHMILIRNMRIKHTYTLTLGNINEQQIVHQRLRMQVQIVD